MFLCFYAFCVHVHTLIHASKSSGNQNRDIQISRGKKMIQTSKMKLKRRRDNDERKLCKLLIVVSSVLVVLVLLSVSLILLYSLVRNDIENQNQNQNQIKIGPWKMIKTIKLTACINDSSWKQHQHNNHILWKRSWALTFNRKIKLKFSAENRRKWERERNVWCGSMRQRQRQKRWLRRKNENDDESNDHVHIDVALHEMISLNGKQSIAAAVA